MKLNVHNLLLDEAIEEIMMKFYECVELGDKSLEIIHGYKHGTSIKDHIRSNSFLNESARSGYKIISKNFSDAGVTIFQLESLKKKSIINPIPRSSNTGIINENKTPTNFCLKCNNTLIRLKELNWYKCPKCGKLKK